MGDFNPAFSFSFDDGGSAAQPAWEFASVLRQAKLEGPVHGTSIDHKIAQRLSKGGAKAADNQRKGSAKAAGNKRRRVEESEEEEEAEGDSDEELGAEEDGDEDEDEEDDDEDDDAPLPGELDDDSDGDDDDDEEEDDDEDEEDGDGDAEEEEEEQNGRAGGKTAAGARNGKHGQQQQQQKDQGGRLSKAAAKAEADSDEEDDDDEGEDGEGDSDEQPGSSGGEEEEGEEEDQRASEGEEEEEQEERGKGGKAAAAKGKKASQQQQQQQGQGRQGQLRENGRKGQSEGFYSETPEGTRFSASSFADLNLSRPLLKAVEALGYKSPTPIQAACIPIALAGRDICGSAVTGSGKTAAFALPFLERLLHRPRGLAATYVLVLTPTRELAVQVHSMVEKLSQFMDVTAALIVGGLSLQVQAATLRKQPEVVVATPGRLLDHLRNSQSVGLEDLAVLVLDEADRLLEMGFKEEVMEVVRCAPRKRQTMLFSATFNDQVRDLVSLSLKQPVRLAADAARAAPKQLAQEIVRLKGAASAAAKEAVCLALCGRSFASGRTIIFCKTKTRAHRLKILFGLAKLPPAAELHGNMSQTARLESLESFRRGDTAFLLATDVAARGLDIQGVEVVVNYDAPSKLETYLHRIGRTARAGAAGVAVTLVEDGDRALLKELSKKTGVALRQRVVPPQAVAQWQARVEAMERDVSAILAEERQEADLRKAEMEANKAANMLEHEDEIMARPKRTWFQTERQKRELQRRTAAADGGEVEEEEDGEGEDGEADGGKQKKGQLSKAERKAARKAEAAKEAKANKSGKHKPNTLETETQDHSRAVRSIKSLARELQQQQGLTAAKAAKMAAQQLTGLKSGSKKKNKAKRQKTEGGEGGGGGDGDGGGGGGGALFSGDGLNTSRPGRLDVKAGGDAGGMKSIGRFGGKLKSQLSKTELNKLKRGGKGKGAFKSKSRFKRKKR